MALLQIAEPGMSTEPHQHRLAAGIDLGTTNSLVATVRNGIAVCINDEEGRALLPSIVHYRADGITEVGWAAQGAQSRRRGVARKGPGHLRFQHAAHGENLFGFLCRWRGDKGAARRLQCDQAVLGELEQGLAHQRARHAEMVGQLLLCQLGARAQFVLHDGAGEGLDDGAGGGR